MLKEISKQFGKVQVLQGINLEVNQGEFCVLLGPSGCGKSTLLNIIAGLVKQDAGTVLIDGQIVDHLSPRERDIAMVFQSYALYPHMTVAENLGFGLRMRKVARQTIIEQVTQTARLLEIEDLLGRKPSELSGGQRQRVAMGRALVRRPKLFLLDEPLSNLDARLRANVRLELKRLHQQIKGTILYVTHDQIEAMTLGDRVVVMKDGGIRQVDMPQVIYSTPEDTFVARFIGSPEINLYQGRITLENNRFFFRGSGFIMKLDLFGNEMEEGEAELGLRPEDIEIVDDPVQLTVKVEMTIPVGSENFIQARIGNETITIRVSKDQYYLPGFEVFLKINPNRIHLFRNGKRMTAKKTDSIEA